MSSNMFERPRVLANVFPKIHSLYWSGNIQGILAYLCSYCHFHEVKFCALDPFSQDAFTQYLTRNSTTDDLSAGTRAGEESVRAGVEFTPDGRTPVIKASVRLQGCAFHLEVYDDLGKLDDATKLERVVMGLVWLFTILHAQRPPSSEIRLRYSRCEVTLTPLPSATSACASSESHGSRAQQVTSYGQQIGDSAVESPRQGCFEVDTETVLG